MADSRALMELLLPHVIKRESGGNPNAVSPKGALGLGQVMPATGVDPGYGVRPIGDAKDPAEQMRFTRDYLEAMARKHNNDPELTLAAYNAGPGNVAKHGGVPPFKETQEYVKAILGSAGLRPMNAESPSPALVVRPSMSAAMPMPNVAGSDAIDDLIARFAPKSMAGAVDAIDELLQKYAPAARRLGGK